MRIVSLLPAATDIVAALQATDELVGRTHECDWPPERVAAIPAVTGSEIDQDRLRSREISDAVGGSLHGGSSLYTLDTELLAGLAPDLVLTQDLCEVCAVSYAQVSDAVRMIDGPSRVLSLEPATVRQVFDCVRLVAETIGRTERSEQLLDGMRTRLDELAAATSALPKRRVAAIEWLDPLWPAGHWVPELIEAAGGLELLANAGEHTTPSTWDELRAARPEVLLLMPCGFSPERTEAELHLLTENPQWNELGEVEVWVLDGPAYFNRPGPRIVRGAEILAWLLHGVRIGEPVRHSEARQLTALT